MLDGIDFGGPEQRFGKQVYSDFLNYYDQGAPKRLGEELRAAGNDIIILDFPDANGAEYIQRNAFVLIQLIQNVNDDLRSRGNSEKLTVIGPSMGGLVSRYALAFMEQKFNDVSDPNTYQNPRWNHNTRLWLSFDSPQLGANIPIGDQQWLLYYAEIFEVEAAKQNLANLDNAASKEMLVHHYRSTSHDVSGTPGFRDRFQAEVDALGMPAQLRRIAVVNGSIGGIRQDWRDNSRKANGCDKAFTFEVRLGTVRLFYLKFLTIPSLQRVKLSDSRVFFSPDYGQTCLTFNGSGYTKSSRREFTNGRSGSIGYDVAPGSWRATQADIASAGTATNAGIQGFFANLFLGGLNKPSQTSRFYDVVEEHCFIPTVSALALTNPNRDLGQNLSGIDLVCSGETPFDSYFAPTQNEEHITVTAANAAYIKDEIGQITPTPVFTRAPASACPAGGTFTFQVKQECTATRSGQQQPATTYNWTVTAGGTFAGNVQQLTGAGPTQAVTIAPAPSNTNVAVSVTAIRAGYATSTTVTKFIYITDAYATVAAPGEVVKYDVFDAVLDQANTTGPYTWSVSPPFKASIPNTATGPSIKVVARNAGQITISATGTDVCTGAPITALSATVTITTGGLRPAAAPAAYPNPADAVLNLATPETAEATAAPRTAVLYNAQGREVRRNSPAKAAELPTADLPAGLYYLLVEQGGHVSRSQIRVQH